MSESEEVSFSATNSCTGEAILFEGTMHSTTVANVNLNGTITIDHTLDMTHATGMVPITGVRYTTDQISHDQSVVDFDFAPTSSTLFHRIRYVRAGETKGTLDDNIFLLIRVHVTIDANGVPRASTGDFKVNECF